jgi:hypothetical protein
VFQVGLEANFLVAEGVPGLEITEIDKIKSVFSKGVIVMTGQKQQVPGTYQNIGWWLALLFLGNH